MGDPKHGAVLPKELLQGGAAGRSCQPLNRQLRGGALWGLQLSRVGLRAGDGGSSCGAKDLAAESSFFGANQLQSQTPEQAGLSRGLECKD